MKACGLFLFVFGACVGGPAAASGKPGPPSELVPGLDVQRMPTRQPLVESASRIRRAVEKGGHEGELPKEMKAALAEAIAPAEHSRAELNAAVRKIGLSLEADPSNPVHTVQVVGDGSGLRAPTLALSALPDVDAPVTFDQDESTMVFQDFGTAWRDFGVVPLTN